MRQVFISHPGQSMFLSISILATVPQGWTYLCHLLGVISLEHTLSIVDDCFHLRGLFWGLSPLEVASVLCYKDVGGSVLQFLESQEERLRTMSSLPSFLQPWRTWQLGSGVLQKSEAKWRQTSDESGDTGFPHLPCGLEGQVVLVLFLIDVTKCQAKTT